MAELFTVFKKMYWKNEELEELLAATTKLMGKVPIDIPVRKLVHTLIAESPVVCYKKRIHEVYKGNEKVVYKIEREKVKHSVLSVAITPLLFVAVFTIGAVVELLYTRL
eukprot:TRINITY_DN1081_c0_g3_i2.p3 TRINITY_DN1081_c0_g3~~TRINITY_DN1081_c0_g3_i2.p3  ORF type:complete len:109 (-),score=19.44 TRINITY_DN1081_c0_g3_i2:99-425(-)